MSYKMKINKLRLVKNRPAKKLKIKMRIGRIINVKVKFIKSQIFPYKRI